MGEKDLAQKRLEEYPDVSADLMNALMYEGKSVVRAEKLSLAPTETIYADTMGKLHNQFNDVSWYVTNREGRIVTQYIIGNQMKPERRMVLRKAGYQGVLYKGQLGCEETYPVIGIVLYWGKKPWNKVYDLKSLWKTNMISTEVEQYIDDIRLHVYNMAHLPEEIRNRFKSDMRIVVDYLAMGKDYEASEQLIEHLDAFLHFMTALTGDKRYEIWLPQIKKEGGKVSMCELLDKYINKGVELGKTQGIELGKVQGRASELLNNVDNLMSNLNWPLEKVCAALAISTADYKDAQMLVSKQK